MLMPNPIRTRSATLNENNINVIYNKRAPKQHTLNVINVLNDENEIAAIHRIFKTRSDNRNIIGSLNDNINSQ